MKDLFVKRTLIGHVLKVIGLVVISWGIIQGFVLLVQIYDPSTNELGLVSFLSIFASAAIYGILLIGFGEVIDLLQKIHDQNALNALSFLDALNAQNNLIAQELQVKENDSLPVSNVPIPLFAEEKVEELYVDQNIWVDPKLPMKNSTSKWTYKVH